MINSHYVPQFILRNFLLDNKITYCNLDEKTVKLRNTKSIFSEEGYYPEELEKSLSKKIEYQFATLFHNKLESATHSIILSSEELFLLKKYLITSIFRYKEDTAEHCIGIEKVIESSRNLDFDQCLNDILECNSQDEAIQIISKLFDWSDRVINGGSVDYRADINYNMAFELKDMLGSYIVFVSATNEEKFIIPDIGEGFWDGPLGAYKITSLYNNFLQTRNPKVLQLMHLVGVRDYRIFPLSPKIAVLSMNSFYRLFTDGEYRMNIVYPKQYPTLSSMLGFGDSDIIRPPKIIRKNNSSEYRFDIKSLPLSDVCHLNCVMLAESRHYFACSGINYIQRCLGEIENYSTRDYSFLIK